MCIIIISKQSMLRAIVLQMCIGKCKYIWTKMNDSGTSSVLYIYAFAVLVPSERRQPFIIHHNLSSSSCLNKKVAYSSSPSTWVGLHTQHAWYSCRPSLSVAQVMQRETSLVHRPLCYAPNVCCSSAIRQKDLGTRLDRDWVKARRM